MDRSGQVLLGKYRLTRMLGKGGMGEVWEGEHQLTGRRVAVKVLSDAYLSNKKVVARFGREARAASAVQHDGIVEILDQDRTDDGVPFLVMEFLDGESVGQRIKRKKRLSESEALAVMSPLLDALNAAHQAGVIHRDLKPDNVFILPGVRGEERIKILDFGISQKADEIEHRLTQEGSVLGTPHYMSPEQARGEANIDVRVDVYAAAVMFYECVVGEVPFDAGNYNALLQIIISRPPVPPRARGADICGPVEQVVMAALSKRREERPPNARVFRELLLEAALESASAHLDPRTWKFKSMPANDVVSPSLRPAARGDFSLEADVFNAPPATGNFHVPRDSRHFEVPFSNNVSAPLTAAARRARASAPAHASLAPEMRVLVQSDSSPERRAAETAPRITLTGAAPLELEDVSKPAPVSMRSSSARHSKAARPLRPMASGQTPKKRSMVGAIVGWIAALCALAALIYVASAVFKRPDPRKHNKTPANEPAFPPAPGG